ncbi:MAG: NAD(P)/FAD-dependent oxidoreductase [Gammaproteobacteria bacterium]|nr:MAG: NAD(P)/FAD-dependent oxidoreductase [Gammaproteobacteria bacterium]
MNNRVTVVGAGFAALTAVRKLRALAPDLQIDLVAPKPEFVYYPGTIWIPTGLRKPEDLVIPLDNFFRRQKVSYHQAEATGLSEDGRTLHTSAGDVPNDGIIIASGGQFMRKLPGIEHAIIPCGGIPATTEIRDRLQAMQRGTLAFGFAGNPKEPSAMRGGPVFEFLFGIDTWLRQQGRRGNFKLIFFTPAPKPGARLGPKAVEGLLKEMARREIETHLGHKMKGFEPNKVITEGGEFEADLILFMPGMTGNKWFEATPLARSEGGLLKADAQCRAEGAERVYVAGDSGSFPGPEWLPKQAHMADLQAEAAAQNLIAELSGKQPEKTFKAELMCIVDSFDKGMFISRSEKGGMVLPGTVLFHWAKRAFERWYLRQYR